VALVAVAVFVYFGVRGLTAGNPDTAVRHAHTLVNLESHLGLYREPAIQDLLGDSRRLTTLMNWVYVWGHWPVIALALLWLALDHPAGFRVTRNAMIASGAVGLVVFACYPVAPPRLAGLGFTDTVTDFSSAYRVLQPTAFVNQYAAMPSLHVGWDLLIGLALFAYSTQWVLRLVGAALPLLMATAVLATANHYIVDVLAGVTIVLVCRAGAVRFERSHAPTRAVPAIARVPRPRSRPQLPAPRP
jgi:membrane-associated phospholipid phosphatase